MENFDGSGYPDGLRGDEINYGSRILGICREYDRLMHARKPCLKIEALVAIERGLGRRFHPDVLTAFLKFNRPASDVAPAPALERVRLGYQDDVVTFEFVALDFAAPERNRYAYRLEGFDSDWIELAAVHRVTYTDLPHGSYVLRVKAANNDGLWNEQGLAVPVQVLPPPWRTWWAYLAYLLLGAGTLVAFVRAQQKKLKRETEYRRRLEVEVQARTQELARQNEGGK